MSRPSSIPLSRPCVTKAPVPLSHTGGHEIPLTRARRPILRSLDAFFRRRDTWLAEQLNRLSSTRGTTYAGSLAKRALDLVVSVPLAVIIVILIVVLAT